MKHSSGETPDTPQKQTHVCDSRCLLTPEEVAGIEAERHRQLAQLAAWREQS